MDVVKSEHILEISVQTIGLAQGSPPYNLGKSYETVFVLWQINSNQHCSLN